jgi:galactokinase
MRVRATAPGRVNLIGDHTDYMGGLVLPMAIHLATTVEAELGGSDIVLVSDDVQGTVALPLPVGDPATVEPAWGRYVAGVARELGVGPDAGLRGRVASTVPAGSGLSSSAALEVAVALALGASGSSVGLAELCQRAEAAATGVPCGIMDQLTSLAGVAGHALLIDCATLRVDPVPLPAGAAVWVLHSGVERRLAGSAYAERRSACEAAAELVGPLPDADPGAIAGIEDPVLRARARHVSTECDRVRRAVEALRQDDLATFGELMVASHDSLRDDFEVSLPELDDLVGHLLDRDGVFGARLTGAGFGGCVVALAEPGVDLGHLRHRSWRVDASDGARLERLD